MKVWSSLTDRGKAIRSFILVPVSFLVLLFQDKTILEIFSIGKLPVTIICALAFLMQGIYYAHKSMEIDEDTENYEDENEDENENSYHSDKS